MRLVIVNEHETCQAIESREEDALRILSLHSCLLYQHLGQNISTELLPCILSLLPDVSRKPKIPKAIERAM